MPAGIVLIAACMLCAAAHAAGGSGLFRDDGTLVDRFSATSLQTQSADAASTAPVLASEIEPEARFPSVLYGPVRLSAATRERNAAFRQAAEPGVAIRDLLGLMQADPGRDSAADRTRLGELLTQLSAMETKARAALEETGRRIDALVLDPSIQQRHAQTVQTFEAARREYREAVQTVIRGEADALGHALEVAKRLEFRADPPLLQGGLPFRRFVQQAPVLPRADADARLASAHATPVAATAAAAAPATAPTPEDLAETPDIQFTPEIRAKAAALDDSPQAIFDFVSNRVAFQPYLGSRKGAAVTLSQLRGNDTDQASLLIALLRAAGIPARYVRGTAEREPEAVMSWLGVDDASTAASILTTAGLDGIAITDGADVVAIRWTHVWVEAYVPYSNYRGVANDASGPIWIALDPSFKPSRITPGEDALAAMGFEIEPFLNAYIASVAEPDPLEHLEHDIQAYLDANDPGKTLADVERRRQIAPLALGLLPAAPPFRVLATSERLAALEDDKRYKVRFHLHDGGTDLIDHTIDLPALAGSRLTIEYIGATEADQATIDAFGGIYETPPNLVDLVPVLELDGVAVATSSHAVGMGRTHSSDMTFIQPTGAANAQPLVENEIIAGNGQAIGFDTFLDLRDTFLGNGPAFPPEDFLEGILHTTANDYLSRVDRGLEKAERLMRVVTTQDVSEAIVQNAIAVSSSFGVPVSFEWTGLIVDADRRIVGTFDVDGDGGEDIPFMKLTGAHGSLMENRVFEETFDQDAVSTIKILQLASEAGIPICTIRTSVFGDCPGISQPSHVLDALNSALSQGHEITIPQAPITASLWSGTGYIDLDPTTGAGGYIISGGISGAVQALAGGATVDRWPVALPCEATDVDGDVLIPEDDAPHQSAVFCADNSPLRFQVEFTTQCKDGSTKTHQQTFVTSRNKNDIGYGSFTLKLVAFGSATIIRRIEILKPRFEVFDVTERLKMHQRNIGTGDEKTVAHVWTTSRKVDLKTYLDTASQAAATKLGDKLTWFSENSALPSSELNYGSEPGVSTFLGSPYVNAFATEMRCEDGEVLDKATVIVVRRDANTNFESWEQSNSSPPAADGWISEIPRVYARLGTPGFTDPEGDDCDNWAFETKSNNYHPGMVYEGRGSFTLWGPGNQATYNAAGNLINNPGRGGRLANGTADQENASNKLNAGAHLTTDVLPFIRALQLDGNPTQCTTSCTDLTQAAIIDADHIESYFGRRPPKLGSALAPDTCP